MAPWIGHTRTLRPRLQKVGAPYPLTIRHAPGIPDLILRSLVVLPDLDTIPHSEPPAACPFLYVES